MPNTSILLFSLDHYSACRMMDCLSIPACLFPLRVLRTVGVSLLRLGSASYHYTIRVVNPCPGDVVTVPAACFKTGHASLYLLLALLDSASLKGVNPNCTHIVSVWPLLPLLPLLLLLLLLMLQLLLMQMLLKLFLRTLLLMLLLSTPTIRDETTTYDRLPAGAWSWRSWAWLRRMAYAWTVSATDRRTTTCTWPGNCSLTRGAFDRQQICSGGE